jgi:hypothetical protein
VVYQGTPDIANISLVMGATVLAPANEVRFQAEVDKVGALCIPYKGQLPETHA